MIVYWVLPFLVLAAPPIIVLLSILIGGSTIIRPTSELTDRAQFQSDSDSRAGEELRTELGQRAAREELRCIIADTER
jgi:hypothetical protein